MNIMTVAVVCAASEQYGPPVPGAVFKAKLNATEYYQGFVVPGEVTGTADANGICVLNLWPNALGVAGSLYEITATHPITGKMFLRTTAAVPASSCNLHEIIVQAPFPPKDASQQALEAAQGALAPVSNMAAQAAIARDVANIAATLANQKAAAADASAGKSATSADAAINNAMSASNSAGVAADSKAQALSAAAAASKEADRAREFAQAAIAAASTQSSGSTPETTAIVLLATQQAGAASTSAGQAAIAAQAAAGAVTEADQAATDAGQAAALAENKASEAATAAQAAATAKGQAETAAGLAASAKTAAETAAGTIDTAAQTAAQKATEAQTAAGAASGSAVAAGNAAVSAGNAATNSQTAAQAAETARAAAALAKTQADTAAGAANTAAGAAGTAKTAAETAANTAGTQKTAAEQAAGAAATAKAQAETAAQAANTAKLAAQDAVVAAKDAAAGSVREQTLTYGANGNVAWDAALGTYAYLHLTQPVTTIAMPTGLPAAPPASLTLVLDQDPTGNRQVVFAAGYNVKKPTDLTAQTRAILALIKKGGGSAISGGYIVQGIPMSNQPTAPQNVLISNITTNSMKLAWDPLPNTVSYNAYRNNVKANANPITGTDFIAGGLTPSSIYNWVIRGVNAAGEGEPSEVKVGTTAATVTQPTNAVIPVPPVVSEIFFEGYEWPHSWTLNDIDPRYNTVIMFTAQPSNLPTGAAPGTPEPALAVPNQRDNIGDGRFQFLNAGEAPISNDKIAAIRASGKRFLLAVGGANNGFNFSSHERAVNFLASFKQIVNDLGGMVDGIYWNTFELYMRTEYTKNPANCTQNTTELVWISQQLRDFYGQEFTVTMAPAPNAFGNAKYAVSSPYDLIIAKALRAGGVLSYVAPQYYDNPQFKDLNDVSNYHKQWVDEFGASMVVMGLSHGNLRSNFDDCMSLTENDREVTRALQLAPGSRGFYMWSQHDKYAPTYDQFLTSMVAKFGATPAGSGTTPNTPPNNLEDAATAAFGYTGGQNGAWLEIAPARLRDGTAAASAAIVVTGQQFGRIVERSTNDNDVLCQLAQPNWGVYNVNGLGKKLAYMYVGMRSITGGGSGQNPDNGFTICASFQPRSYYYTIFTDADTANVGRTLRYDPDYNGVVFSVGTGTNRVQVVVEVGTLYQVPNNTFNAKAWHDRAANTINLVVNGVLATAPLPTYAAGSTDYMISGTFGDPNLEGYGDLYGIVFVHSALTAPLRDNLAAYTNSLMV
jgi:hypothetical protein